MRMFNMKLLFMEPHIVHEDNYQGILTWLRFVGGCSGVVR